MTQADSVLSTPPTNTSLTRRTVLAGIASAAELPIAALPIAAAAPAAAAQNLIQAAKLTRANAAQVDALAKHRNKGKQRITIEHVHVYDGGQAAFIAAPGEGVAKLNEVQPHAITHAASAPLRCQEP
jgi:hypothetical protein